MPFKVEKDGKEIEVYTKEELDQEVAGLKVTLGNIKGEKEALESKVSAAKEEARVAEEEKARAEGDHEKLLQLQIQKQGEADERLNKLVSQIKTEKVGNAISDLVTKLGAGGQKSEDLRDLIKARFVFDYDNENGAVNVTGDGVNSIEDLQKSVKESGRYDAYIAGSSASGGGSTGQGSTGVATGKKFEEYSGAELAAIRKENPAEYERLLSVYKTQ